MEHVPVFNQRGRAICAPTSAAELIDAYRFSHGDSDYGHMTSPLVAAIGGAINAKFTQTINYVEVAEAYEYLRKYGSCSQRRIEALMDGRTLKKYVDDIEQYYKDAAQLRKTAKLLGESDEVAKNAANQLVCDMEKSGLPEKLIPANQILEKAFLQGNDIEYLNEVTDNVCKLGATLPLDLPPLITYGYADRDFGDTSIEVLNTGPKGGAEAMSGYLRKIHERLNRKNAEPVEITYCEDLLYGKDRNARIFDSSGKSNCGEVHASVLIGQRRAPDGRCQLLIRNSWGPDANCKDISLWDCETGKGNVWVDAESLARNTLRISWIADQ